MSENKDLKSLFSTIKKIRKVKVKTITFLVVEKLKKDSHNFSI